MKVDFPDLGFKGERNYVQGPDIYDSSIFLLEENGFPNPSKIDFRFHSLVSSQLSAELHLRSDNPEYESPNAILAFEANAQRFQLRLIENGKEISSRKDYEERLITSRCAVVPENQSVHFENSTNFSCIEIVVAMNKFLLNTLFPEIDGKWLFTRLVIGERLQEASHCSFGVSLDQFVGGCFTKSTFVLNGKQQGNIFFSLV